MRTHTSERRLTPLGVTQAHAAGVWMKEWLKSRDEISKRFYVSPYVRTMETAAHLALGVEWRQDVRICERNWGSMDALTYDERIKRFGETLNDRKELAFFWRPSDGETLQDVFSRLRDFGSTLARDCSSMDVVVVCHGEVMWIERTLLEYWTPYDLRREMKSENPQTKIHNCRIIQYSRELESGELAQKIANVRFINPMAPEDPETNRDWQPVRRPLLNDQQLLSFAESHQRFLEAE